MDQKARIRRYTTGGMYKARSDYLELKFADGTGLESERKLVFFKESVYGDWIEINALELD